MTVYFELPDVRLAAYGGRAATAWIVFDVGNIGGLVMSGPSTVHTRSLTRRSALGIVALALVMPSVSAFAQTPAILVHKDPDCSCCAGWVQHVKDAGFGGASRSRGLPHR